MSKIARKSRLRSLIEWGAVAGIAFAAYYAFSPASPPTLEEYVATASAPVKTISSGTVELAGTPANCNNFPLVLDNNFEDHGGAWPQSGFMILNPKFLFSLPKAQQFFTFYHECGHMSGLKPELDADCYSIKHGRKNGWLDQKGLDQLCAYWLPKKGDSVHPSGKIRCEHMISCFNE